MAQNKINGESKKINAINRETVHRICSGQVVLSLAIAVKELVENAIDAGATNIDIRLKEYGSELIEVCDNGSGVEEENFAALTLKHFTSKLRQFSDLESVSTLGFRGEALSSLCALSNLSITTKHKSVEYATKIEYDSNGHIKNKTKCARQIGTTVSLSNLFTTLPVRHKEFNKNLKREFIKMCQLLHAYCLISEGIRIVCTNQTKKGAKSTVIATQGSKTVKENIICVFGIKQLESLVEIKMHEPAEKYLEDYGIKWTSGNELPFKLEGFISKCTHGNGRSASDRQFYYINSRPCEPNKIMKLVNEVYKYFNGAQYPFVFLNIKTAQHQVDVNVTPDKRQVFLEEEKLLLATLKTTLLEIFKDFPSTLKVQNLEITMKTSKENERKHLSESLKEWAKSKEKILDTEKNTRGLKRILEPQKPQKGTMSFVHEKRIKVDDDFSQNLSADSDSEDEEKQIEKFVKESYNSSDSDIEIKPSTSKKVSPVLDKELKMSIKEFKNDFGCYNITIANPNIKTIENRKHMSKTDIRTIELNEHEYKETSSKGVFKMKLDNLKTDSKLEKVIDYEINESFNTSTKTDEVIFDKQDVEKQILKTDIRTIEINEQEYKETGSRGVFKMKLDDLNINSKLEKVLDYEINESLNTTVEDTNKFQETISTTFKQSQNSVVDLNIPDLQSILNNLHLSQSEITPSQIKFKKEFNSKDAESELERHISKDMFKKMEIVGQFNKGFIITKLDSDLFIIDQHATDEKYNFETLQKTTVLQNQKLVVPKPLELTAANELLLIDNIDIFKKNGFSFQIDENAEPRQKVKLTAMPVSKNWEFGKEAIDELLFMLQEDSATENMRPSGIRSMFASRACRKSVMIGSSLSTSDMRRLVEHMGEIDQPWNCPHGRPTMRHLVNLDLIKIDDSSSEEENDE